MSGPARTRSRTTTRAAPITTAGTRPPTRTQSRARRRRVGQRRASGGSMLRRRIAGMGRPRRTRRPSMATWTISWSAASVALACTRRDINGGRSRAATRCRWRRTGLRAVRARSRRRVCARRASRVGRSGWCSTLRRGSTRTTSAANAQAVRWRWDGQRGGRCEERGRGLRPRLFLLGARPPTLRGLRRCAPFDPAGTWVPRKLRSICPSFHNVLLFAVQTDAPPRGALIIEAGGERFAATPIRRCSKCSTSR